MSGHALPSDEIDAAFRGRLGSFTLDAAIRAPARGVTAIFGPSGCGKTSLLRCIAGLTRLEGHCQIGAQIWQDDHTFRPTHRRDIGYVFQEASLFPHLTVTQNLLYARRIGGGRGARPSAADPDFDEITALLGLEPLLGRSPAALSGGERQRVAIGRALLSRPRLMLLDEPLSALDDGLRAEILPFLERLRDQLALPMLYVTHDLTELQRLAETVVLMDQGRVLAAGSLAALQADPALPLARGAGAAVTLNGQVAELDPAWHLARINVPGGAFTLALPGAAAGQSRRLSIHADDVSLTLERASGSSMLNILPAIISSITDQDAARVLVVLRLGADGTGATVLARITRRSASELGLVPGRAVYAQIKGVAVRS